jgi:hypothetical protein
MKMNKLLTKFPSAATFETPSGFKSKESLDLLNLKIDTTQSNLSLSSAQRHRQTYTHNKSNSNKELAIKLRENSFEKQEGFKTNRVDSKQRKKELVGLKLVANAVVIDKQVQSILCKIWTLAVASN